MKKFLRDLLLYTGMLILLLWGVVSVTDKGLRHSDLEKFGLLDKLYAGKMNAGILVQGNSHAWVQVDPLILDSVLQANAWNIGSDGYNTDVQLARYRSYRRYNRPPRVVIQTLDYYCLQPSGLLIDRQQFIPFFGDSATINALLRVGIPAYMKHFPFMKWQENWDYVYSGWGSALGLSHWKPETTKGYKGVIRDWDGSLDRMEAEHRKMPPEFSMAEVAAFEAFLDQNRKENIRTVLVFTPHYFRFHDIVPHNKRYRQALAALARKHDALWIDCTTDSICYNKNYFYNGTHLNKSGAELFTRSLAVRLAADSNVHRALRRPMP